MKKFLFLAMMAIASCSQIFASNGGDDVLGNTERIQPEYLDYVRTGNWGSNWFLAVHGGMSAYIDNPTGCGDFNDRLSPMLGINIGKWISPDFAVRASFQGLDFKDANKDSHSYFLLHGDIMYDLATVFRSKTTSNPRWHLSPYIGIGVGNGTDLSCNQYYTLPSTTTEDVEQDPTKVYCSCDACNGSNYSILLAYGLQAQFQMCKRLALTAEFGMNHVMSDFDGQGSRRTLSSKFMNLSVGLQLTIGKYGWDKAIDARPYMAQNDELLQIIDKYKKGGYKRSDEQNPSYSGLDALKRRLQQEQDDELERLRAAQSAFADSLNNIYAYQIPIYFFFKKGTDVLTDQSQLANLSALVKIVKQHHLTLRIEGAADAATGTPKINESLGAKRARFLAKCLKKRGIPISQMRGFNKGGIREHKRIQEDRYAKVAIWIDLKQEPKPSPVEEAVKAREREMKNDSHFAGMKQPSSRDPQEDEEQASPSGDSNQ